MGLTPDQFWELTPAEFYYMVDGHGRKQKRHRNEILYGAWYTAMLMRQEKIPPLSELMQDMEPKEPQTDDDMLAMVKVLNAAFGGEVVECKGKQ